MSDSPAPPHDIDTLLAASHAGSAEAFGQLFSRLYPDLRRIARRHLRGERSHHTLCTTALVNEAYLRIAAGPGDRWQCRPHFLAFVSRAMRHILVDYARRRGSRKRGGGGLAVTLDEQIGSAGAQDVVDVVALSEALDRLAARDPRLAQVVECRFFGGLTAEETAEALGIPLRTVERGWARAKAYLYHLLRGGRSGA